MVTDRRGYRRDVRGRFTRVPVEAAYADDSRFPTVAREGIDVGFEGADPADLAYDSVARYASAGDELAQGGDAYPPGIRRPVLVHPDDAAYFNGLLRTAARDSGPMDPSAYLTGLGQPETSPAGRESAVTVFGDGGRTMTSRRAEDVAPGPRPGGVRTVSDADDREALRAAAQSGLVDLGEAALYGRLRPGSRGGGRGRDR